MGDDRGNYDDEPEDDPLEVLDEPLAHRAVRRADLLEGGPAEDPEPVYLLFRKGDRIRVFRGAQVDSADPRLEGGKIAGKTYTVVAINDAYSDDPEPEVLWAGSCNYLTRTKWKYCEKLDSEMLKIQEKARKKEWLS